MTKSVGVHQAKTHLSRLLDEVAKGEEIEITNRGREYLEDAQVREGRGGHGATGSTITGTESPARSCAA